MTGRCDGERVGGGGADGAMDETEQWGRMLSCCKEDTWTGKHLDK